jgi:hypothetical protein
MGIQKRMDQAFSRTAAGRTSGDGEPDHSRPFAQYERARLQPYGWFLWLACILDSVEASWEVVHVADIGPITSTSTLVGGPLYVLSSSQILV